MKRLIFLLSVCLLALSSCEENMTYEELLCPEDIACTEELRYLSYSPKHNGKPVILDEYYVKNLDNGNFYQRSEAVDHLPEGSYLVITDQYKSELRQDGTILRFFGIQNGQITLQVDFKVGHDCCHIIPLGGPFDQN